jgi:hypothetical protein
MIFSYLLGWAIYCLNLPRLTRTNDNPEDPWNELMSRLDHESENTSYSVELLEKALKDTAGVLDSRGKDVRLIVVGGIIATLVTKTRSTTHDVDFFTLKNPRGEIKELLEISAVVGRRLDMSPEWLNNATQLFIKPQVARDLEDAAEHVIFQEPGLTLVSAPYRYLIASKIDRIAGGGKVAHDIADAAGFIHELRRVEQLDQISHTEFIEWATTYNTKLNTKALKDVANFYKQKYGEDGVAVDAELM